MAWSSVKRLSNEMDSLESDSDRFIQPDMYYIVRFKVDNNDDIQVKTFLPLRNFAESMLSSDPRPAAAYHNIDTISLIFSCSIDSEEHQFSGSHHRIVSKYASALARVVPLDVSVGIIEFETQTQIVTYLGLDIFHTSQNAMKRLSGGKITDNLLHFRTEKELRDMLNDQGVDWNDVDPAEKYGTLIKLKSKKGKVTISSLSEHFDARETKRYINFVFN